MLMKAGRTLWINLFFATISLMTLTNGILVARKSHDWIVSDWLINYQGGFVRRGLPGEVALKFAQLIHVRPERIVVFFYLGLFLVFLASMRKLVLRSSCNLWVIFLLISPVTFSFQILHVQGGYRKEMIFLSALALLASVLTRKEIRQTTLIVLLTLGAGCGILSHELILFYLPYLAAIVLLSGRTSGETLKIFAVPAVTALVVAWICSHHTGDVKTATGICHSLGYQYPMPSSSDICSGGPIGYLTKTPAQAMQDVSSVVRKEHYLFYFPIFALLALVPLLGEGGLLFRKGRRRDIAIIGISALISFAGSLVLFLYAIDWGRWIYIHIVSITILLLFVDAQREKTVASPAMTGKRPAWQACVIATVLACYGLCWALPNDITVEQPIRWGYVGRAHEILESKLAR